MGNNLTKNEVFIWYHNSSDLAGKVRILVEFNSLVEFKHKCKNLIKKREGITDKELKEKGLKIARYEPDYGVVGDYMPFNKLSKKYLLNGFKFKGINYRYEFKIGVCS